MESDSFKSNPLFQLLQDENIAEFNKQREKSADLNLSGAYLRGLDLRNMNAKGLNLSNAYLRGADIRGVDFSQSELEGASIAEAKISGCFFPKTLSAEEIKLSVEKGTRLRYR